MSERCYVKGRPTRFIGGHATRKDVPDRVVDANGCRIRQRGLNPASGCGMQNGTHYAEVVAP